MRLEKSNIPANLKSKFNTRFRNFEQDLDNTKRKLEAHTNDRSKLFGARYTDNPDTDTQLEQRQQLAPTASTGPRIGCASRRGLPWRRSR
jgi:vesicle transport through interaction with t-SNAREs protein 1